METKRGIGARPLSPEQAKKILQAVDRSLLEGKQDYAFLLAALATQGRVREMLHMRVEQAGTLPEPVQQAIQEYLDGLAARAGGALELRDILFPNIVWYASCRQVLAWTWPLFLRKLKRYAVKAKIDPALIHYAVWRYTAVALHQQPGGFEEFLNGLDKPAEDQNR
jgi:hypothetical protein